MLLNRCKERGGKQVTGEKTVADKTRVERIGRTIKQKVAEE